MTSFFQTSLQNLVRQRLAHKAVLKLFLQSGVGRILATHLGYVGLYAIFGEDILHLFKEISRSFPTQSPILVIGDHLEELLVDWFLSLSHQELTEMLPSEKTSMKPSQFPEKLDPNYEPIEEPKWVSDLLN